MNLILRAAYLLVLPLLPLIVHGQATYWGMTSAGGSNSVGTIYTITEGNVFSKKFDFTKTDGGNPKSDLLKAANGLYYGVTQFGGTGAGLLFSFNATTGVFTSVASFTSGTTGSNPVGGLVQSANGRLYGVCQFGGANNKGTIFEYTIGGSLVKRVDFNSTNGEEPFCKLILGPTGTMWGTTAKGGANSRGAIFEYTQATTSASVRFSFGPLAANTTGHSPRSGLVRATNNRLYGVAPAGGANSGGTVYEILSASPYTFTVVQALNSTTGSAPIAALVESSANVLHGTTTLGGANSAGSVFKVTTSPSPATFTKVDDLAIATGYNSFSRMIVGSGGLLYGTTSSGGPGGKGTLFSYNTSTDTYTMLADMAAADLDDMWGGVVEEPAGTLYGLTNEGGSGSAGALFKFVVASSTFTEMVGFASSRGTAPKGRLLKASNGLFYGLCSTGGRNDAGVLFSFNPTGNVFTRIADLGGALGGFPYGTLIEVSGKLYGVCSAAGGGDAGSLIEYTISTNSLVKKADFSATVGSNPLNGLMRASNGKLYGTTSAGGTNGAGTLFEYTLGATSVVKRYDLNATNGTQVLGDLFQASNGLLYGTASTGGQFANGTLFSFDPTSGAVVRLYSFDGLQGGAPAGDLMQASNGKLYGMCKEEGLFFMGCIFSWNITTNTYTEEYDMTSNPDQGKLSESNLVQGTDGLLYGTCTQGGTGNLGTVFRFDPISLGFTVMQEFTGASNGQFPFDGLARETTGTPTNVVADIKLFLEGPYNSGTGLMNDALRVLPSFPLTEPFTATGFTQVGSGGETIASSVLTVTGNNAIVDWVLVELRDKGNSATILRTKPALLQRDGNIVDLDGTSLVSIAMAADNYFISVRHRNHFAVMTAASTALSTSTPLLDLTTGAVATFGTNAQKTNGAVRLSWAGNVVRDALLKYTGSGNDRDPILTRIGGTVPTATAVGYFNEDVNLDGTVKYTGTGNDRDPILVNIGGTVPTNTRAQQLP